jgi:hypothetical protein
VESWVLSPISARKIVIKVVPKTINTDVLVLGLSLV